MFDAIPTSQLRMRTCKGEAQWYVYGNGRESTFGCERSLEWMGHRRVFFLNIWRFNAIVESPSYLINSLTLPTQNFSVAAGHLRPNDRRQRIGISRGDGDNMAYLVYLDLTWTSGTR